MFLISYVLSPFLILGRLPAAMIARCLAPVSEPTSSCVCRIRPRHFTTPEITRQPTAHRPCRRSPLHLAWQARIPPSNHQCAASPILRTSFYGSYADTLVTLFLGNANKSRNISQLDGQSRIV